MLNFELATTASTSMKSYTTIISTPTNPICRTVCLNAVIPAMARLLLGIIVARDGGMEAVARTMAVRVRIGVFARGTRIWNETQ
tara:strand:- start:22703 stop:22954 length:252 start_codon:yes stop_codon:yes gene_type:complete